MSCGSLFLLCLLVLVIAAVAVGLSAAGTSSQSPSSGSLDNLRGHTPTRPSRASSRRRATPEQTWVGRGKAVEVAGYQLTDGMVYVGRDLPAVRDHGRLETEPALIQPHLGVRRTAPERDGASIAYWPSYETISDRARAGYLEWLAAGRRSAGTAIGFVFLFFYGIERRVLSDAQTSDVARTEVDGLLQEVEELISIYGDNSSFRGYATSFLEVAPLLHRSVPLSELEPPFRPTGWDLPLTCKLALGAYAKQGEPIPTEWALSWVLGSQAIRLRTPARRCPEEFQQLFRLRYPGHFRRGGLRITPNKSRLRAAYRPASPSFGYGTVDLKLPDLPDVTILSTPIRKLQAFVDKIEDNLDVYSRWVGRKDDRESPAALALLPEDLATTRDSAEGNAFLQLVERSLNDEGIRTIDSARLVKAWPSQTSGKLTRQESTMLAQFLAQRGIGIEPDCRFGGPVLGKAKRTVVFRLGDADAARRVDGEDLSPPYQGAALLLRLAVTVAAADGEISSDEEQYLRAHVERNLELSTSERLRLTAHLGWLLEEPPGLAGLKRRLEDLEESDRRDLAKFLVTVAGADGKFDPEEINILQKIYPLLGLDADHVFADVHALMTGRADDAGPVTVATGRAGDGFAIPPATAAGSGETVVLDAEKIRATRQATERLSSVLADIFVEEEDQQRSRPTGPTDGPTFCGLDVVHSAFLVRLGERTSWQRVEVEQLADHLGVLPDGALELINEAAISAHGSPVLEGVELIEVDPQIFQEMLG